MPRPGFVVGWMAATAAAVGIAHAGVSTVAGGVVDPLPPTVGLPSPAPTTDATSRSAPTEAATPPSASPTAADTRTPTASPSTPPSAAPAGEVRSYALVGGSATLRFAPGRVTVVAAEPRQGFTVQVEGDGTAEVRVQFDGDDHRSRLRGSWEGGPRDRVDEDADRGDDDDDDRDDD